MVKCSVYKCESASYKNIPGIRFQRFPKDKELRDAWLRNANLYSWTPNPSSVICSLHFEEHLFKINNSRIRLVQGAIPTIFEDSPSNDRTTSDEYEGMKEPAIKAEPSDTSSLDSASAVKTEPTDANDVLSLKEETVVKEEIEIGPTVIWPQQLQYIQRTCKHEPDKETSAGSSNPTVAQDDSVSNTSYSAISDHVTVSTVPVEKGKRWPHRCHICNKHFISNSKLVVHLRIHTGERPFMCQICEKSFIQIADLNVHVKIHSGVRPYTCEVCKKSFTKSTVLNTHMLTHTDERLFHCRLCNKNFKRNSDLNTHLRKHSDDRPYTCDICEKSFKISHNLIQHKKLHTGERPFSCDVCKKCFTRNYHLKLHMNTHKPTYDILIQ